MLWLEENKRVERNCARQDTMAARRKITMITLQPAFCLCVLLLAKTAHRVGHGNVQLSGAVNDGLYEVVRRGSERKECIESRILKLQKNWQKHGDKFWSSWVCIKLANHSTTTGEDVTPLTNEKTKTNHEQAVQILLNCNIS
jgi:hypothetical protein